MQTLFGIDWQHMWLPSIALAELILRGSLIYLDVHFVNPVPVCFGRDNG